MISIKKVTAVVPDHGEAAPEPDCKVSPLDFEWVGPDTKSMESIRRPSISYWRDALRRLFHNKTADVCMAILALIILLAIVVPVVSPYTYSEQHVTHTNAGLYYKDPSDGHVHLLGTDYLGRDILVRLWNGARTSLKIALTVVVIDCIIGLIYGGISGYFGGSADNVMMRIVEIINGVPYLIIVVLLMIVMKPGVGAIITAYAMVGWTGMSRLVRGQIVSLKGQEFLVAAQVMGARPSRIILKHLFPNILSIVIINVTLDVPGVIFSEAFLSFIGLGVPQPIPSWGVMANDGARAFQMYPSQLILPAVLISLTMLTFNLLGDALRDAFDPKLRR